MMAANHAGQQDPASASPAETGSAVVTPSESLYIDDCQQTRPSPSPTGMATMNVTSHSAKVRRSSSIARSLTTKSRVPRREQAAAVGKQSERKLARKHRKTRHREREHIPARR